MRILCVLMVLGASMAVAQETYVGYVSDSGCALARASAGRYTATNPDCARRCVKEGKKIVLVEPERKTVFQIDNPAALASQVGNKVQVYGTSTKEHRLHVDKVIFLEASNPECDRPRMKN